MKNKEKFAKEIIDVACKGDIIAVTKDNKVVGCDDIYCEQCLFDIDNLCHREDNILYRWAESEYIEKPTITSREKKFLDVLLPSCKYIARDNSNEIYIYTIKNQHERIVIGIQMMVLLITYQQIFLVICSISSDGKIKNLGALRI